MQSLRIHDEVGSPHYWMSGYFFDLAEPNASAEFYDNPITPEQQADWDRRCTVTDEDREWGRHENAMERMRAADLRNYGDANPAVQVLR